MTTDVVKLKPDFSWKKMAWKAVRPALLAAGLAFLGTATDHVKTEDLTKLGVPAVFAIAIQESVRNYGKQHGWWANNKG